MEDDPYEIWREAMAEIENQQRLAEYEAAEFNGPLVPGRIDPDAAQAARDLAQAFKDLYGDEMDEEKEKKASRLISVVLFLRAITSAILVVVFGALTYALIANRLNGWEFIAACSVWFGMGVLFIWGTDIAKKEQEDGGE